MHLTRIAEFEEKQKDVATFSIWLLRQLGVRAEIQPLFGADYSKIMKMNWKPTMAIVVPKKDEKYADKILEVAAEFNWEGKTTDKRILPVFLKELERRL